MIPGYRLRFYCFLGAFFCLGSSWLAAQPVVDALTLWQFDTLTGPRRHKVTEHLVFSDEPWRFSWYLLTNIVFCTVATSAGVVMSWVVLRGRRAFKRWPDGF